MTVIEKENGDVDVSIMDPAVAMSVVENEALLPMATEVRKKLEHALEQL